MMLDFENFSVEIDAEATRQAYEGVHRVGEGCDCAGCRNFALAIGDGLGEGGRRFFASVGIDDPAQAIGLSVYFTQKDGTLCYGAWYHLFGSRLDVSFRDGDGIIGRDAAFGDAAIVQMDLYADVPWVLDEPNPYLDE